MLSTSFSVSVSFLCLWVCRVKASTTSAMSVPMYSAGPGLGLDDELCVVWLVVLDIWGVDGDVGRDKVWPVACW